MHAYCSAHPLFIKLVQLHFLCQNSTDLHCIKFCLGYDVFLWLFDNTSHLLLAAVFCVVVLESGLGLETGLKSSNSWFWSWTLVCRDSVLYSDSDIEDSAREWAKSKADVLITYLNSSKIIELL